MVVRRGGCGPRRSRRCSRSTPMTISPKSEVGSIAEASAVVAAPSCTSRMTMSAPAAFSSSAVRLAATTGGSIVRPAMPAGDTSSSRWSVTAPTKPTWMSPKSWIHDSGSAGDCRRRCARWRRGTPTARRQRVGDRVVRRHHPIDEIVVALVELVVADGGHLEAGRVQRVDGRLVLLDERLERRGADQVAGGREHGVRVLAPGAGRQRRRARPRRPRCRWRRCARGSR